MLLAARDGGDLLMLQSLHDGPGWQSLDDLPGDSTAGASPRLPLQQHRIRKGL